MHHLTYIAILDPNHLPAAPGNPLLPKITNNINQCILLVFNHENWPFSPGKPGWPILGWNLSTYYDINSGFDQQTWHSSKTTFAWEAGRTIRTREAITSFSTWNTWQTRSTRKTCNQIVNDAFVSKKDSFLFYEPSLPGKPDGPKITRRCIYEKEER